NSSASTSPSPPHYPSKYLRHYLKNLISPRRFARKSLILSALQSRSGFFSVVSAPQRLRVEECVSALVAATVPATLLFSAGGLVRPPERLGRSYGMSRPSAPHEQRITQPIQVADRLRRHAFHASQRNAHALGAAADGARDVQLSIDPAA